MTDRLFSPKPTGWNDARTGGTPAKTAVRIMGLLGRTSATANSKAVRIRATYGGKTQPSNR